MAVKTGQRQKEARHALDQRYLQLKTAQSAAARPAGGWLRAVREALGMTVIDVADRLEVAPSSVTRFEQSELAGRIQLDTMERMADVLGCDLVYLLVPRRPLEDAVTDQATMLARRELSALGHTMDLEAQGVSDAELEERERDLVAELKGLPGLWRV
jgi:predicted DNA-binding mobile mystery protein A